MLEYELEMCEQFVHVLYTKWDLQLFEMAKLNNVKVLKCFQ